MRPVSDTVEVGRAFASNPVIAAGDGSPVVYLHGPLGQEWPGFLDDLAARHRVYAPASAGIADPADLAQLDTFADLALYYDDLLDGLGLDQVDLIGHSFGGMAAAEFAAFFHHRVRRLVLIDAMGLWLDETPVEDHVIVNADRQAELLYGDHAADEVRARLDMPDDVTEARGIMLDRFDALAATSHFIHPVPERGLSRRLPRVTMPTLLIWGAEDQLVPPAYAEAFQAALPQAEVALVEGAGHHAHLERRAQVSELVLGFLGREE